MKKIFALLLAGALFTTTSFAQAKGAKQEAKKTEAAKPAAPAKKTEPAKPAAPAKKVEATKPATPAAPVKKDGTPDKRFKANKTATVDQPAGPVKKDGTPDMRYKANKNAKKAPAKKG